MTCSMLRGFLKIVVLKALGEGPKSGYALMKFVEEKVGSKPSSGSMYPLLEHLEHDGLVEVKGVGRTKEYKLTISGKHNLESIEEKRNECIQNMLEGMKMMSALTGEDMHFPMAMVESIKKGELPFKEVNPEMDNLRNQMLALWKSGVLKKKSARIKKVLSHAVKELKSV